MLNALIKIVEVSERARKLFDVVEVWNEYMILGLESRVSRNLDDFFVDPGDKFGFPGFAKYFSPLAENVLKDLRGRGFEAEQVRKDDVKFKQIAVEAGIGEWGKNSLAIHPVFGPWLRFVVFKTNRKFKPGTISQATESTFSALGLPSEPIFEKCHSCDRCVKACPISALQPFKIPDRKICIAWQQLGEVTTDVLQRCDLCLQACMPQRP